MSAVDTCVVLRIRYCGTVEGTKAHLGQGVNLRLEESAQALNTSAFAYLDSCTDDVHRLRRAQVRRESVIVFRELVSQLLPLPRVANLALKFPRDVSKVGRARQVLEIRRTLELDLTAVLL